MKNNILVTETLIRLLDLYKEATPENHREGMIWYHQARSHAKRLSLKHNVPLRKVVGIISALSPNNKWHRNLLDADLFLDKPLLETKVCTYTDNRIKAIKILSLRPDQDIQDILGGTKTKSFYDNILNENSQMITVDLWMYRAVGLEMSVKNYQIISDAIKLIADNTFHKKGYIVQATLWTVIRNKSLSEIKKQSEIAA